MRMKSFVFSLAAFGLCFAATDKVIAEKSRSSSWPESQPSQSGKFEDWMAASAPVIEPLIPIEGVAKSVAEDEALRKVLFEGRSEDIPSRLQSYVASYPQSRWRPAIELNLGQYRYRKGFFTRAIEHFKNGYALARDVEGPNASLLAGSSAAQLSQMYARLGRMEDLEPLLKAAETLEVGGSAGQILEGSRSALHIMQTQPGMAFKCGPLALARVREQAKMPQAFHPLIVEAQSPWRGFALAEVSQLASRMGMNMVAVKAPPDLTEIPVPSVVHWKQNHYAAIVSRTGINRYLVRDLTFGLDAEMELEALKEEASGYFLIDGKSIPKGWTEVQADDAWRVYGRGYITAEEPNSTGPGDPQCPPSGTCPPRGMASYSFHAMMVSLRIVDTPVGYAPPVGPDVSFSVHYSQKETVQPTTMNFGNIGKQWGHNWSAWIEMPNSTTANVVPRGGGAEIYTRASGTAAFVKPNSKSAAQLVVTGSNVFERLLSDGSKEVYSTAQSLGGGSYRVFLTEIHDPAGNMVSLTYDGSYRLITITDAIGQETTFSYANGTYPYRVTKVEDPFGREAIFSYNSSGQLESITDAIGIVSSFSYGTGDFVNSLTTPYGTTTFSYSHVGEQKILMATDPLGRPEKLELNYNVGSDTVPSDQLPPSNINVAGTNVSFLRVNSWYRHRNSFYWDRKAYAVDSTNRDLAVTYHWLHTRGGQISPFLESIKKPFESREFFNYPGQDTNPGDDQAVFEPPVAFIGIPSKTAKVVNVVTGTQQVALSQRESNSLGKPTKIVDPIGRETVLTYAGNNIDLVEVKQKNAGGTYDILFTGTYNAAHRPLIVTGADGGTTTYTWNDEGQLESVTNELSETTEYVYDEDGRLEFINPPLSGTSDQIAITYDSASRVKTRTQWGYTLTYDYDDLDRVVKLTYPDSTTEEVVYEALHPRWIKDRINRWTRKDYNAAQEVVGILDPAAQYTAYEWCNCGDMKLLVDAQGNATRWTHNAAGQKTSKIYADGRTDTYSYNPYSGWLQTVTDAASQQVTTEYALDGRPVATRYLNEAISTPDVTLTWDPKYPRVTAMVDGTGTTSYTYRSPGTSGAGRAYTIDGPLGNDTITLSYDDLGRVTSRTIDGTGESVAFDTLGRVATVTNPLDTFTVAYSGTTGLPLTVSGSKGMSVTNSYYGATGDYRPETTTYAWSGTQVLAEFGYQYDAIGRITRWDHQVGSGDPRRVVPDYDPVSRLVGAVTTNPDTSAQITTEASRFDRVGNRLRSQSGSVVKAATFNNLNQLQSLTAGGEALLRGSLNEPGTVIVGSGSTHTDGDNQFRLSVPVTTGTNQLTVISKDINGNTSTNTATFTVTNSGTQAFTYDLNGNTTADGAKTYSWDGANRLVRITYSSTNNYTEFSYDGAGRRVRIQEVESGTVSSDKRFVWDELSIAELRAANGTTVQKRFYGGGFQVSGTSGAAEYFYVRDHLGSVRAVIDENGAERGRWNFELWGSRGSNQAVSSPVEVDFGYTGHYVHERSGMVAAPFRFYDPAVARWISRDPIAESGGLNLYGYVANNPINMVDPTGELAWFLAIPAYYWLAAGGTAAVGTSLWLNTPQGKQAGQDLSRGVANAISSAVDEVSDAIAKPIEKEKAQAASGGKSCEEEWAEALAECMKRRCDPDYFGVTGGYFNLMDCAKGLVSERCGGNLVDYGPGKRKKK
jgi:RHS repeat-associated protein